MKGWSSILNNNRFPWDNHPHNTNNNICGHCASHRPAAVCRCVAGHIRKAAPRQAVSTQTRCNVCTLQIDRSWDGPWLLIMDEFEEWIGSPFSSTSQPLSIQRVSSLGLNRRGMNRRERECWRARIGLFCWTSCASSNLIWRVNLLPYSAVYFSLLQEIFRGKDITGEWGCLNQCQERCTGYPQVWFYAISGSNTGYWYFFNLWPVYGTSAFKLSSASVIAEGRVQNFHW